MRNKISKVPTVQSVVRATEILKCLGDGLERLTDISKKLNLSKTTTYRLLKTLEVSGFAIQDPVTQRFYVGHLVVQLASNPYISHHWLLICASDDIQRLRDLSGESVGLQVKIGTQRMFLEVLLSNQSIRLTFDKGFVAPLHIGAGGKVLLSELPENERQMILDHTKVTMRTNEIIDKEALIREVNQIKTKGYAITFSETIPGSGGISVPIKNYICPVALGVFGPEERIKKNMTDLLKMVKESADRISRKLSELGS